MQTNANAVALLNFLENEAEETKDFRKERTPFDVINSGIQNAYDTLGRHESIQMPPEWCLLALDSIRSLLCEESVEIRAWFTARGLTY